jgi:tRNA modification GTPase
VVLKLSDTIVALATSQSIGAIAVIRLSGNDAISIADKIFVGKKKLNATNSHNILFGKIIFEQLIIDEVVVGIYKAPHSYTAENVIEISCHGSNYIIEQIINSCIHFGARLAEAGEFTKRAFMNGKLDLSQAEAVADLIASENSSQHAIAMQQMRGGISNALTDMRNELINFAALMELELDFSEEDVTFADRTAFEKLLKNIKQNLIVLQQSFALGNAIKNGIPVAIVGKPNVGKSTLLNLLLNDERAIVSNIPGTTRDVIEDVINIKGIAFRFIDTAGIRQSDDTIENLGIAKTFEKVKDAHIVLLLADVAEPYKDIIEQYEALHLTNKQQVIFVLNKIDAQSACDAYDIEEAIMTITHQKAIAVSAKNKTHINKLISLLLKVSNTQNINTQNIIITNVRHAKAISATLNDIEKIEQAFALNLSSDLISGDVRSALYHLGSITGQVEIDRDILGTIFGKFCIGK